jgi:adenylylsulfate kinase-like enzyme
MLAWLNGISGAGKTTTARELVTRLAGQGTPT